MKIPTYFFLTLLLFFSGCGEKEKEKEDVSVLARVGDREFRIEDLDAEVARLKAAKRPVPELSALLQEMVDYEVLLQSARESGLESDPQIQRTYNNHLIGLFKERMMAPLIEQTSVSEAEIVARYEAESDKHRLPERARLGVILVAASKPLSAERSGRLRERAEEARKLALSTEGTGFSTAAVKFSGEQSSRYKGGDLGWVRKGERHSRVPQTVVEAGFDLRGDEVSKVIEADGGYYLVKILEREPESLVPLEKVRDAIQARLLREKRAAITKAFAQSVQDQAGVDVFYNRLEEIAKSRGIEPREESKPPEL